MRLRRGTVSPAAPRSSSDEGAGRQPSRQRAAAALAAAAFAVAAVLSLAACGDGTATAAAGTSKSAAVPAGAAGGARLGLHVPAGYDRLVFNADFAEGVPIDWRQWADRMWYGREGDGGDWRVAHEEAPDLWQLSGPVLKLRLRYADAKELRRYIGRSLLSGMMTTDPSLAPNGFATRYGYFEARLKAPRGPGPWPAFWLMPQSNRGRDGGEYAEIDIMEIMASKPDRYWASIHYDHDRTTNKEISLGFRVDEDFHTYGVSWESDFCIFYVDGRETFRTRTPDNLKQPMYIILTMSHGGWDKQNKIGSQTPLPAEFAIDYVRVWRRAE
jgi:beta-glucanase (GH16 family)